MKLKDILEVLGEIWKQLSATFPPWLVSSGKYAVLLLVALWVLLFLGSQIKKLWLELFGPLFYDEERKRRSYRRRLFADHVESELRRLNNLEEWSDYRFAELEAEVEAEGRRRRLGLWPRTVSGLRRERSLSRALRASTERLILLEGEPGSGKSVALRYVATQLARRAMTARRADSLIPVYVNLKELNRPDGRVVDRNLIQDFVLASLNRVNSRDVDEYLEEEFDRGLQDGAWLFLFDSFDELPEVLSATEADATVHEYADAIANFLSGFNQCRGILASRFFRGPKHITWPRFRILPLKEGRRHELVRKSGLGLRDERDLIGRLATASSDIQAMTSNPMLLGLICQRMRDGLGFPENTHSVLGTYIENRLSRDAERVKMRFDLTPAEIREAAEAVAFAMSTDQEIGLSAPRRRMIQIAASDQLTVREKLETKLRALEYLKLARSEISIEGKQDGSFTFAHRRFQEYFSTCMVLRNPDRVAARSLITDARWREAAVTMCQTQSIDRLEPLLSEANVILSQMNIEISEETKEGVESREDVGRPFSWPSGALHLLKILQDGFEGRSEDLPDSIRSLASRLIFMGSNKGTIVDQKAALEVAGAADQDTSLRLIRGAFESDSQWLADEAYYQVSKLRKIPKDIGRRIRLSLARLSATGRLRKEYTATIAHLRRLDRPSSFLRSARLLLSVPVFDFATLTAFAMLSFGFHVSGPSLKASPPDVVNLTVGYLIFVFTSFGLVFSTLVTDRGSVLYFLSSLIFRLVLASLAVSVVANIFNVNAIELPPLLLVAVLYVLMWAPSAAIVGKRGQLTSLPWWLMYPVFAPVFAVAEVFRGLHGLKLKKLLALTAALLLFVSGTAASIFFFLFVMSPEATMNFIALFSALALWPAYSLSICTYRWLRWSVSRTELSEAEFLRLLEEFSIWYRLRFLRAVRFGELLKGSEMAATLEDLLFAIGHSKKWNKETRRAIFPLRDTLDNLTASPATSFFELPVWRSKQDIPEFLASRWRSGTFAAWCAEYTKHRRFRLATFSPQAVDELSRILERIYLKRKDAGLGREDDTA